MAAGCQRAAPTKPASTPRTSSRPAATAVSRSTLPSPITGSYGDILTLVQRADGSLIGSFKEEEDPGPAFSCGFLLQSRGPLSATGELPVVTWWPDRELNGGKDDEVTTGTLFLRGDSVSLQLPKQAHGGCWRVEPELDAGELFEVGSGQLHPEWKALRVVGSDKLPFHHQPDANDLTKAYVVRGDLLALLDTAPQDGVWHHVVLITSEGPKSTGWVLESGLLPWSVPNR